MGLLAAAGTLVVAVLISPGLRPDVGGLVALLSNAGGARTLRNRAAEIREGTSILRAAPRSRKGPSSQAASF